MRAVTLGLLYCFTLATWRQAELGFLGLIVHTLTTKPRPWGQDLNLGVLDSGRFDFRVERGRRHWPSVAIRNHCGVPELHQVGQGMSLQVA
jgi:hypothetical protein